MDYDFMPCSNDPEAKCKTCHLHNNGCPVEEDLKTVNVVYNVAKAVNPKHTIPKAGADVEKLVKDKYPKLYHNLTLDVFDWKNNLDGVLDFLYGEKNMGFLAALFGLRVSNSEVSELIRFIESNCEVRRG
ncbi:MAG: hypothetical protein K2N30_02675 [Clostridia bacterium]|nr:hypothetical protein [Clostridia bacterium]